MKADITMKGRHLAIILAALAIGAGAGIAMETQSALGELFSASPIPLAGYTAAIAFAFALVGVAVTMKKPSSSQNSQDSQIPQETSSPMAPQVENSALSALFDGIDEAAAAAREAAEESGSLFADLPPMAASEDSGPRSPSFNSVVFALSDIDKDKKREEAEQEEQKAEEAQNNQEDQRQDQDLPEHHQAQEESSPEEVDTGFGSLMAAMSGESPSSDSPMNSGASKENSEEKKSPLLPVPPSLQKDRPISRGARVSPFGGPGQAPEDGVPGEFQILGAEESIVQDVDAFSQAFGSASQRSSTDLSADSREKSIASASVDTFSQAFQSPSGIEKEDRSPAEAVFRQADLDEEEIDWGEPEGEGLVESTVPNKLRNSLHAARLRHNARASTRPKRTTQSIGTGGDGDPTLRSTAPDRPLMGILRRSPNQDEPSDQEPDLFESALNLPEDPERDRVMTVRIDNTSQRDLISRLE